MPCIFFDVHFDREMNHLNWRNGEFDPMLEAVKASQLGLSDFACDCQQNKT